ncbi:hypothetical protein JXA88_15815 [Candidatus Fermentibacteria bacterium]|nr:hypothetical protein [Candidatus Fermentibacteria bacterium]
MRTFAVILTVITFGLLVSRCSKELEAPPGAPGIEVTSPSSGDVWDSGSSHEIRWTSQGTSGHVKIDVSDDAGSTREGEFSPA